MGNRQPPPRRRKNARSAVQASLVNLWSNLPTTAIVSLIPGAHFNPQRTLPDGWQHIAGGNWRADPLLQSQSAQAGTRKHEGIILAFVEFAQSSVNVPAKLGNDQVSAYMFQLGQASRTRSADNRPGWQRLNGRRLLVGKLLVKDERIARDLRVCKSPPATDPQAVSSADLSTSEPRDRCVHPATRLPALW